MRVSFLIVAALMLPTLAVPISHAKDTDVCFCREEVSISLDADAVVFESLYCFENRGSGPCEQKMHYGFHVDSVHMFPDTISVAFGFMDLDYETTETGIAFTVAMPEQSCASVRVIYRQACLEPSFCYTPKTIAGWSEPIEEADFEIRVPAGLELTSVSYSMHEVSREKDIEVHRFTCKDCLPSEDFCLKWDSE
jgi:hypothetical protein